MRIPNPRHVERLIKAVNTSPYYHLLGLRLREVDTGRARMELTLTPDHLQHFGVVHGGALATMIDSSTAWALYYSVSDEDAGLTSIDLKVNYLAPALGGLLHVEAKEIKLGRTVGYAEASVYDEGDRLLAHGTSTVMVLPDNNALIHPPFPPKFIESVEV